ncbi:MAG: dimethyl sulfoxide reductase anchor subunit [Rhodospirillales bacterium]|nr:dimethyl sulfoxide reductase anchor subunit [Rhodospirillales bacterium]
MRPAFSVLFLTTLIGAGQGLVLALVAGQFYWVIGGGQVQESSLFYAAGSGLTLALLGVGLFASFFHLAHPERAWRAATRWRTSWLSREVILLPIVMGLTFVYGALHFFGWSPTLWTFANMKALDLGMLVGYLAAAAALLLFVATGMVYACMKFIQEWASPLTVLNFTLMGLASGFTLATAYAAFWGSPLINFFGSTAVLLTAAAMASRVGSLFRNRHLKRVSSLRTAIGLHHQKIRQISQGFTAGSYNTREFFHPGGPGLLLRVQAAFLVFAFPVPLVLLLLGWGADSAMLYVAAFAIQYAGLIAERWAFFAEARHPQNLYYQRAA